MSTAVDLKQYLSENSYPGRGIAIGRTADGTKAALAYFIMGRSANSRNRVFVEDGQGIRTQAFDPAKLEDPSLIIYAPVRVPDETHTIVTNGDQTDTVYDGLRSGLSFEESLRSRCFEPDGPNYTPRISGLLTVAGGTFGYTMSILKSNDGDPAQCLRFTYDYPDAPVGEGHFLSTYLHDGSPLPSFSGEPLKIRVPGSCGEWAQELWESLNPDNKVSLFVRYITIADGSCESKIINKNV